MSHATAAALRFLHHVVFKVFFLVGTKAMYQTQVYDLYQGARQTGETPSKRVSDRQIADDHFGQTDS